MARRRMILLGPPGAGKGTHAERVSAKLRIPHVATGDMLRHEVEAGTELGARVRSLMDEGELAPDELVVQLAVNRLSRPDAAQGWILDGFPRNLAQARGLDGRLHGRGVDLVIAFDVPVEEIIDRLDGRRTCPRGHVYHVARKPPRREGICDEDGEPLSQRSDDKAEVVRHRVDVYERETQPLLEFYESRGLLRRIDGSGSFDEVHPRVIAQLEA